MAWLQQWKRLWQERHNKLWVLPALNCVLAVLLALVAAWIPPFLPADLELPVINVDTLENLLTVIASSMLAVATFSLSIMVSAFASASNSVTPRATELVMGDEGTRTAIATFLSAFIFSVVAQTALGLKYYGDNGRFILFIGTLLVLVGLMVTLLRWVRTLSSLGRLGNTLDRVEKAAEESLQQFWQSPLMGAQQGAIDLEPQPHWHAIRADALLLVRRIDMEQLHDLTQTHQCTLHLRVRPGAMVTPGDVLAWVEPSAAQSHPTDADAESTMPEWLEDVASAFHLDTSRTFDQDPRFSVIVLREAAQRALSTSVNDPGTAIACLHCLTRALLHSQRNAAKVSANITNTALQYPALTIPALDTAELVVDGFDPIVRDGADSFEMMVRLQKMLALLHRESTDERLRSALLDNAIYACERATTELKNPRDQAHVQQVHDKYFAPLTQTRTVPY